MKYISSIVENKDIQDLVVANEAFADLATTHLLHYNLELTESILENIDSYVVEGDLASTYENIRNQVLMQNLIVIEQCSEILSLSITEDEKSKLIEELFGGLRQAFRSGAESVAKDAGHAAKIGAGLRSAGEQAKNYTTTAYGNAASRVSKGVADGKAAIDKGFLKVGLIGKGPGSTVPGSQFTSWKTKDGGQDREQTSKLISAGKRRAAAGGAALLGAGTLGASALSNK